MIQIILHQADKRYILPLCSSKGGNYNKLQDLLRAGRWKEADQETADQMHTVMGRQKEGLRSEDIQSFPCEDLRIIDQLWVNLSQERFGFSVQKKIWAHHSSPTGSNNHNWMKFGHEVGWKKTSLPNVSSDWKTHSELTFAISAPIGHLPHKIIMNVGRGELFSRVNNCGL